MSATTHTLALHVERLAHGGEGVAHLPDGRVCFVEGGLPGARWPVELTQEKRRMAWARVTDDAWHQRLGDGDCPQGARCGGCLFQGVPPQDELRWKREAVSDTLRRLARSVAWPDPSPTPTAPPIAWRRRARLHLSPTGALGYYGRRSTDVIATDHCHVLTPALQALTRTLRDRLASPPTGAEIHLDEEQESAACGVVFHIDAQDTDAWTSHLRRLRLAPELAVAIDTGKQRHLVQGEPTLREALHLEGPPVYAALPWGAFRQANTHLHTPFRRAVRDAVLASGRGHLSGRGQFGGRGLEVLELYGGAGNFAVPLAEAGCSVEVVEGARAALEAGEAAVSQLPDLQARLRWTLQDLRHGTAGRLRASRATTLLADPPRGGLSEALRAEILTAKRVRSFVYVSCEAASLARDVEALASAGWRVDAWQAWDMFPRTPHLELVVSLTRS